MASSRHQTEGPAADNAAFVIMPFAANFDDLHHRAIRPAIEAFGLAPKRYDDPPPRTGSVTEEMRGSIDRARVVIAVVTGRNPHVFFELGMTLAHRKPCVLLAASKDDVPDFLRDLPHVVYADDVAAAFNGLVRQIGVLLAPEGSVAPLTRR